MNSMEKKSRQLMQVLTLNMIAICMSFIMVQLHVSNRWVFRGLWLSLLAADFYMLAKRTGTISGRILMAAFLTRAAIIIGNLQMDNIISNRIFRVGDDIVFTDAAREFYFGNMEYPVNSRYFPRLISRVYRLFGPDDMIMIFILMTLAMIGCLVFFYIIKDLDLTDRAKNIALAVVCFAPYNIIFSVLMLREPVYFCFVSLSFLAFLKCSHTGNFYYLILALFLCMPAVYMHWGYAGVLGAYVLYLFFGYKTPKEKKLQFRIIKLSLLAVFILLMTFIVLNTGRMKHFREAGSFIGGVMLIFQRYTGLGGESRYLTWMEVTTIPQLFAYTPLRIVYFLLSPLPMDWRGWEDGITFLFDSFIPLAAIITYGHDLIRKRRTTEEHIAFAAVLLTAFIFCWPTTTAGAALRHRNCLLTLACYIIFVSFNSYLHNHNYKKGEEERLGGNE